jgi:hypothetical protein
MVDVVSIVIAVLSLIGTLLTASITAWFSFFAEERKRLSETEKLVAKYRDPLLLAAQDLQSRLFNITELGILNWMDKDKERKDNLVQYTCFLVGQYLSWAHILRRKTQFLHFSTDKNNRELTRTLDLVQYALGSTNHDGPLGRPFMLWRGQQMAIGEVMSVKDDGELFSMGYAAFNLKWAQDDVFREWFHTLVDDLAVMAAAESQGIEVPNHRLRHLQHLLLQLIHILDPEELRIDIGRNDACVKADKCMCSRPECIISPNFNTTQSQFEYAQNRYLRRQD